MQEGCERRSQGWGKKEAGELTCSDQKSPTSNLMKENREGDEGGQEERVMRRQSKRRGRGATNEVKAEHGEKDMRGFGGGATLGRIWLEMTGGGG